MKKITFLFILNLSFLIIHSQKAKAQWVTIPDGYFASWLTIHYPTCMNGYQMDTTCSGIVNETLVNVTNQNISNLSGIEYFNNLQNLYCDNNVLTNLPSLPSNLQSLTCSNNQLTSLPTLPNSIFSLGCGGNQLSSLPVLPSLLYELSCSGNQLSSLPTLPNSLHTLLCFNNQLTYLPPLPNVLDRLECNDNQLTSIPTLSNTLQYLRCDFNQITSLPAITSPLQQLFCNNNQLTSLPALPNSLYNLICKNNQLTSLPSLPSSLQYFDCSLNQIGSLPEVPSQMDYFYINDNNISCLTNLPHVTNWSSIANNPLTCIPNQTNVYSWGLPLCTDNDPINNPNNCQGVVNITGNVYKDLNSNCAYNNTDWKTENIPVKLYDNQNNFLALSYTINGVYSFAALQPDTFKVKINDVELPIDMACGQANYQMVHLDSTNQTISNINFPVVCDSAFDMQVHAVTRQGWVHPGQVHTVNTNLANDAYWYNLNCSNTTYSGTVTINVNGPVMYVTPTAGALTPIVSGNTFTYAIAAFNNITPTSFGLQLLTDTTAQAGNQICVHVTIATTPLDADTTNNEYDFCYNVTNSYDPNMKEVYPVNVLPGYNDWFTYTIHFQNTGTAPAFNIRLRDTLDTQLDLNTFEFLGASHTATTSLNGRTLSVRFNNIMLPDSTADHDGSMGYYQYRVKPLPNLFNGSNIKNTAYIYFDYNPAIITNTTENHFDMTVGNTVIARKNDEAIYIYPNPSSGIFMLHTTTTIKSVEVFNVMGDRILQQTTGKNINISGQPKGIYYCKVNGSAVVKLVKE